MSLISIETNTVFPLLLFLEVALLCEQIREGCPYGSIKKKAGYLWKFEQAI